MKHAYLIMAHNEFDLLKVLLRMLDDVRNDIYLHIDKKAGDFRTSEFSTKNATLYILDKRMDVRWGNSSQIQLEMLLFETASNNQSYAYYHLLSGVDLPLKSQDYIHDFFSQHQGKEFVGFWQEHDWQAQERVERYYFFMENERTNNVLLSILITKGRNILKAVLPKRKLEKTFKKGPNWVSVTDDFCQFLLSQKDWIRRRFRLTQNGDEVFLQTVIWNSPFKEALYDFQDTDNGCMRFIDWERGTPYVWHKEDYLALVQSDKLFARKFSMSVDATIVQMLQNYIVPCES